MISRVGRAQISVGNGDAGLRHGKQVARVTLAA